MSKQETQLYPSDLTGGEEEEVAELRAGKFVFPAGEKKEIIIAVSRTVVLYDRHVSNKRITKTEKHGKRECCSLQIHTFVEGSDGSLFT